MVGKIGYLLTETYGFEFTSFVSHPLKDRYDMMFHAGPITVLLTDDINTEEVTVSVMDSECGYTAKVAYISQNHREIVLGLLANFAIARHQADV